MASLGHISEPHLSTYSRYSLQKATNTDYTQGYCPPTKYRLDTWIQSTYHHPTLPASVLTNAANSISQQWILFLPISKSLTLSHPRHDTSSLRALRFKSMAKAIDVDLPARRTHIFHYYQSLNREICSSSANNMG